MTTSILILATKSHLVLRASVHLLVAPLPSKTFDFTDGQSFGSQLRQPLFLHRPVLNGLIMASTFFMVSLPFFYFFTVPFAVP